MNTVTILGAGTMESAITTPLIDTGHRVRLQDTHLDDHLTAAVRSGGPYPHTGVVVPPEVTSYLSSDIGVAMAGADVVMLVVSSPGVVGITRLAASFFTDMCTVWLTSKGSTPDGSGRVQLLSQMMEEVLAQEKTRIPPVVAIGGLCKVNEVTSHHPTAPIFAAAEAPERWARMATTRQYRVTHTTDRDSVGLYTVLKNVYAIALRIANGMSELGNQPFHDLKAIASTWILAELRLLLDAEGVNPWTALGLVDAGDLEATDLSGRNKVYGIRIGGDERADEAFARMTAAEQTVEGVPTVEFALRFVQQRHPRLTDGLPLLVAIHAVVHQGRTADDIKEAALSL